MLAVAARIGAPLGHDFCAISLSDNLKPWDVIERAARGGGGGRLRDRALQPDQQGAALAARPRLRAPARGAPRRDAGHLRPRRRPARRAHRGDPARQRPMPAAADMATCVIVGSAETRVIDRGGHAAAGLHAALFGGGERDDRAPGKRLLDVVSRRHAGSAGRPHHHHRHAERARRGDLAVGRRAAAVLGDDGVDAVSASSARSSASVERPARDDVARRRAARAAARPDRRCGRDSGAAARPEGARPPAGRAPGRRRRGAAPSAVDGLGHVADDGPAVARPRCPGRAAQRDERHARRARRAASALAEMRAAKGWVASTSRSMRLRAQPGREPLRAAEAADAHRHRAAARGRGAAGERQRDVEARAAASRPASCRASLVPPRIRRRVMTSSRAAAAARRSRKLADASSASARTVWPVSARRRASGSSAPRSSSAAGAIWRWRPT